MKKISATNVGSVSFDIISNRGAFTQEVKAAGNSAQNIMGSAMSFVGKAVAVAFSVKAVTAFAKACIELGSDLAEVQNVVDVTFGKSASKINAWAQITATAFGISELHAKQFSGTMGAMLKSMGLSTNSAFEMSTALVELAGDMASFYNLDVQTAFEKIRSGIAGEIEPLRQLGINMSVANLEAFALSQGITQSYNAMTQAEKALLRYNYLMSVTADAQGDFSRTSGSWANQTKILKLQFDSLKATLGQLMIQVLAPMLQLLNKIMAAANKAASAMAALFGDKSGASSAFTSTVGVANDVTNSITDTGAAATKAAKKIKNAFATFDEINLLVNDTDSDFDSGTDIVESTGIAAQGISATETRLDSLSQKLEGFWGKFSADFDKEKKKLDKILSSFKRNVTSIWIDIQSLGSPLKQWASTDGMDSLMAFCHAVSNMFIGLFSTVNKVWKDIWNEAAFPVIRKFVIDGLPALSQFTSEASPLFQKLFESVKQIFEMVWTGTVVPALSSVSERWVDLIDIFSTTWNKYGKPVFDSVKSVIKSTKDTIISAWTRFIEPCWKAIMEAVDELWKEHFEPLVTEISEFVSEFTVLANDIYVNFIAPVVRWLQEYLGPVFTRVFNSILNFVKPIVAGITDALSGIIQTLKGVIQFISGVFSGDWNKAWTGIKNTFSGIWKTLSSNMKTPINSVISMLENLINRCIGGINDLIRGFNSIKWNVPSWVPVIGGKSVGFNIRQLSKASIPRLAEGGWVRANNPQLAIVGDNKREGEIIAPESKITEAVEKARGIARDIKLAIDVVVNYPDGRKIIKQINQAQLEEGRILLEV